MKILVLGSRIPYPLHDGGAIATYNMLKSMAELGHEITYFSFNTKKHFASDDVRAKAFPFCEVITSYLDASVTAWGFFWSLIGGKSYNLERFNNEAAIRALATLLTHRKFDLVHFEGLYTIPFLSVVQENSNCPKVLRQHNVEFRIWETLKKNSNDWLKKLSLGILTDRLKRAETLALKNFDAIVSITASDEKEFRKLAPKTKHFIYPAGIIVPETPPTEGRKNTLFHIGSMEWQPNEQAVDWLVQEIFPRIRAKIPDAELHLAGKGLIKDDKRFISEGVINHGEVENSAEFMQKFRVMCVPLKSGSGLRMKTLEAMFMKRAVVSTSIGADGLDKNVLTVVDLCDTATEFDHGVRKLLTEDTIYKNRVEAGYKAAKEAYSPIENTRKLIAFYEKLFA